MRPLSPLTSPLRRAVVVLAWLAAFTTAQAATVQGRLLYKNGLPASDIAVRLTTPAGAVVTAFSYSVRDGRYFVQNVAAGTYKLEIWRNRVLVSTAPIIVVEPSLILPAVTLP